MREYVLPLAVKFQTPDGCQESAAEQLGELFRESLHASGVHAPAAGFPVLEYDPADVRVEEVVDA